MCDLGFDCDYFGHDGRYWGFEMQFDRFSKIMESLIFIASLACDLELSALSDVPAIFSPYRRGECLFHIFS
jgi:hypothetical protein